MRCILLGTWEAEGSKEEKITWKIDDVFRDVNVTKHEIFPQDLISA